MRKIGWLRCGLVSVCLAGATLGTALIACGDSNNAATALDAGKESATAADGPVGDGGLEANASITLAKLTFVNAAADLGYDVRLPNRFQGIRLCFKQGTTDANLDYAPFPPLPDKPLPVAPQLPPALYIGTGEALPSFGIDLSNRILVPILMNPLTLEAAGIVNPENGQPGITCDEILKGNSDAGILKPDIDYWELPRIEAGTFLRDKSYLLVLTGCVGNSTLDPNLHICGQATTTDAATTYLPPGIPGVGNLKITIAELTRVPVSASGLGIHVAYMSSPAVYYFQAYGNFPVEPGFVSSPPIADSGTFVRVTGGPITNTQLTAARAIPAVTDSHYFVTNESPLNSGSVPFGAISLPEVQRATFGDAAVPTIYTAGKNFVFVLVGDPRYPTYVNETGDGANAGDPGATFNLRSYHYLGFPTDPDVANYAP